MANNPIMVPMTVASDSEALAMSVGVSIGGGSAILGTKEITNNGVYNAAADGYDGYSSVDVQVAGGSATLGEKSVTANGVYNASSDSLDGYSKVTVSVPASAVDSGTKNINTNGTHDVIGYASANVSVPASAVDSGTKNITANGNNQDVVGYAAVNVNVPNSYSAGDEGKVVSNGALVAQTAHADVTPTTSDQTIDTTLNNSLKVKGDADLVAGNIKKDVEIFGVTGSYEGGGAGTDYLALLCNGTLGDYRSADVTTIASGVFRNTNTPMEVIHLDNCEYLEGYSLGAKKLITAVLPSLEDTANGYIFNGATVLKKVDLGANFSTSSSGVRSNVFNGASAFNLLVLRKSTVVPLANINAFTGTAFASNGAGGTLYVPQSLISSYQSASNWSTILGYASNQIKSIESTHTDPNAPIDLTLYYADGTPIAA